MSLKRLTFAFMALTLVAGLSQLTASTSQAKSKPPRDAGESATAPTADKSTRKHMIIVGSSTMQEVLTPAILASISDTYKLHEPEVRVTGTGLGIKEFCAGIGTDYPDIVAASRIMRKSEFTTCRQNGVLDIIEVKVGLAPVVVVTKKGDPVFDISARMIYLALAAELPEEGGFKDNENKTWKQVEKHAPETDINVIIPNEDSGSRGFFDNYFLQGGCRDIPEIASIFSSHEREAKCTKLSDDGRVAEVAEPYAANVMDVFNTAPRGTLAVVGELAYLEYRDQLAILSIDGIFPTIDDVLNYRYEMVTLPRYYVKRGHMRNRTGEGVVRGLREFMRILASEPVVGTGGKFDDLGLIPLKEKQRDEVRGQVKRLHSFRR